MSIDDEGFDSGDDGFSGDLAGTILQDLTQSEGDQPTKARAKTTNRDATKQEGFGDTLHGAPKKTITDDDLEDFGPTAEDDDEEEVEQPPSERAERNPPADDKTKTRPGDRTTDDAQLAGIFDLAKEFGVDLSAKYKTPKEALRGLVEASKLVGQRNDAAQWGERLLKSPREIYEALHRQFGQQREEPPADDRANPKKPAGNPRYNPEWEELFEADGKLKPTADPKLVTELKRYQQFSAERGRQLIEDPESVLGELIEKKAKEIADAKFAEHEKKFKGEFQQRDAEAQLIDYGTALLAKEREWTHAEVEVGNGRKQTIVTPAGELFGGFLKDAAEINPRTGLPRFPELEDQVDWAKRKTAEALYQRANEHTGGGKQPPAKQKDNRLDRTPGGSKGRRTRDAGDPWPGGVSSDDLARELSRALQAE